VFQFCSILVLYHVSAHPDHYLCITYSRYTNVHLLTYLVGACNEFQCPNAYWTASAIRYCADQTPEVVWPRGPGREISRLFMCSTSLHIDRSKELEVASRSSKTFLAKESGGRLCQFNLGLTSRLWIAQTEQLGGHSQEQQCHWQAPIDIKCCCLLA